MFSTPTQTDPSHALLDSPGSGSTTHTWASVFVTPRKPHASSPSAHAAPAPPATQSAARRYCRARRLGAASTGLVWSLATPVQLVLDKKGWQSLALARLGWAMGCLLFNVPHCWTPRNGLCGALLLRLAAWSTLAPTIGAALFYHEQPLPVLGVLAPLLMLLEGATAPPPAVSDGHFLEQQLQAEFSLVGIPAGLLRSIHRHQTAAREVGTIVLAPVLTLGCLFSVVAWRGSAAWLAGGLAVAVIALALLALLALAMCRTRARRTYEPTVQASRAPAPAGLPVPLAFQQPADKRFCARWGCSLYCLLRLAMEARQQPRQDVLPRCCVLAALYALEDTLVTTLVPWLCFDSPLGAISSTTRILQAALASTLCAAACRLGRAATRAIAAAVSARYDTNRRPSPMPASPIPPRLLSPALSPSRAAGFQTPPAATTSPPIAAVPLLPTAPQPLAARMVSLGASATLAIAVPLLVPSAQELAERRFARIASWPPPRELLLGAAAFGVGVLLEAAQQPHAKLLSRYGRSPGGLAELPGREERPPAPHAAPAPTQHSVTQLTAGLQLLLGCAAQPAACAALGLLPMSVAGWAVGCAFAAVILLLEMWLWCRSCDANQLQPIDGVLDAACQGEPAHSERFNGAPVRRLELEPSGR